VTLGLGGGASSASLALDNNNSVYIAPSHSGFDTGNFLSQASWDHLQRERQDTAEVLDNHCSDGNTLIEETLLDDEDEPEELAAHVTNETAEAESTRGAHHEYLYSTLNALKAEISRHTRPDCYWSGTFWICPRDPIFVLNHVWTTTHKFSLMELYHLPVFVWLLDFLPGAPKEFKCPKCSHHLIRNGAYIHSGFSSFLIFYRL
jgi:hypothetical protein